MSNTTAKSIFTVENATRPDSPLGTTKALQSLRTRNATLGRSSALLNHDGALTLYHAMHVAKTVGTGKGQTKQGQWVADLGYSASTGSLLVRLGRALVVHSIPGDSDLFAWLVQHATKGPVSALLMADENKHSEIAALRDAAIADKSVLSKPGKARPNEGDKVVTDPAAAEKSAPEVTRTATFADVIAAVRKMIGEATAAEVSALEDVVMAEVERRVTGAKVAREVA